VQVFRRAVEVPLWTASDATSQDLVAKGWLENPLWFDDFPSQKPSFTSGISQPAMFDFPMVFHHI